MFDSMVYRWFVSSPVIAVILVAHAIRQVIPTMAVPRLLHDSITYPYRCEYSPRSDMPPELWKRICAVSYVPLHGTLYQRLL